MPKKADAWVTPMTMSDWAMADQDMKEKLNDAYINKARQYLDNQWANTMQMSSRFPQFATPMNLGRSSPSFTANVMKLQDAFRPAGLDLGDLSASPDTARGAFVPKGAYNREASQQASETLGRPVEIRMPTQRIEDEAQGTARPVGGSYNQFNNPEFWNMLIAMGATTGKGWKI